MLKELPWPPQHTLSHMDFSQQRFLEFLKILGNPHLTLPPILHVAGTNGKGSTCAILKALLKSKGKRVHNYCSPHLHFWNERFILNDTPIDDETLLQLSAFCEQKALASQIYPTHFEALTAIAFLAFNQQAADYLVLEVGLGGRLDATNVANNKLCTLITQIALDHTEFLGDSVDKIAREKAGIMKTGVPCFTSQQVPLAAEVIQQVAQATRCPLFVGQQDWHITERTISLGNNEAWQIPSDFKLAGQHQLENLALAIATIRIGCQLTVSQTELEQALSLVSWPGRLQSITSGHLVLTVPNSWQVVLDVAHNPAGAQSLANWLKQKDQKPVVLVCELTRNRSYTDFLAPFAATPLAQVYCRTHERGPWDNFANLKHVLESLKNNPDLQKQAHTLIICGSHKLVAEALEYNEAA